MNTTPTTEDRIWAVLSHLSALSLGMGILLPVVGWSDQRRKSNYASFQCLQALGYQSVGFTVWALSYLVIVILAALLLLVMLGQQGTGTMPTEGLTPELGIVLIVVFGGFVLYLILPMIAALACALGKDFRYPILGDRLADYLGWEQSGNAEAMAWLDEEREFRWVAAMGHFSILIVLWGMLAPLAAWILQGRNSLFLKFQSIQTLVYHALTLVLYGLGAALYVVGIFSIVVSLGAAGGPDLDAPVGIVSAVMTIVLLLAAAGLILLVPALHILGQWAGYRVLKGENYRYPLLGRLVEKQIAERSAMEEKPV